MLTHAARTELRPRQTLDGGNVEGSANSRRRCQWMAVPMDGSADSGWQSQWMAVPMSKEVPMLKEVPLLEGGANGWQYQWMAAPILDGSVTFCNSNSP